MDWKYKHFHQERVFAAPREIVLEAARTFITESLGWQITDTADGLSAAGDSFAHGAVANLQILSQADGTKVAIELLVTRASGRGFMLFDVGGYYEIQIRKWLDAMEWSTQRNQSGSSAASGNPLVLAANKPSAYAFNGCLVFIVVTFALYLLATFISALVGLLTGNLFLLGRGSITIHGVGARILSAVILLLVVLLGWRLSKQTLRTQSTARRSN
jgi:hypothetical protein